VPRQSTSGVRPWLRPTKSTDRIFAVPVSALACHAPSRAHTETPTATVPIPASLVGTWRRFGEIGPVHEIIGGFQKSPFGDRLMRVRVAEPGEELDYPLTEILTDPRES
jgi:hypothetical protein